MSNDPAVLPPGDAAPTDTARAAKVLVDGALIIQLNMSDTFHWATAETVPFWREDFEEMAPLILKFGHAALTAYAGVRTGRDVMPEMRAHPGYAKFVADYDAARVEIEAIRKRDAYFCEAIK